jgi:hypothetical protein
MWTKEAEREFFSWVFNEHKAKPEQLFYRVGDRHFFYLPKRVKGEGQVMQARNPWVASSQKSGRKSF